MNLSFKPPVQYICVQKPKQTSWLYAETAGSKRDDIQEICRPPALDTANPEKCQILKELASWMQVGLHAVVWAVQEHKNDIYCFELHYFTLVPNFLPLPD